MNKMKITVTQKHIDESPECDPLDNPLVRTLSDALDGTTFLVTMVNDGFATILKPNIQVPVGKPETKSIRLPYEARSKLQYFFDGNGMEPFDFEIELPF